MPYIRKNPKKNWRKDSEREREKHKLYASKEWQALRLLKLQEHPICEMCNKELSTEVHHRIPFMQFQTPEERKYYALYIDLDGLMSLCSECHHKIHEQLKDEKKNKKHR